MWSIIDINMSKDCVKCVTFVSDTFTRYGSKITNVWQEILTPMTLAFSGEVVHEKLWKSVNICKSYGEKVRVEPFLCGHGVYSTMKTEDTEALGRHRTKPSKIKARYSRPTCIRTARIFVHHYNSTQYCKTETVFSIFPFLPTNITSQMRPSWGKGVGMESWEWEGMGSLHESLSRTSLWSDWLIVI